MSQRASTCWDGTGGTPSCDPPIIELSELALTLAAQGREDDAALQLLRDKTGRHRKHLRWAAARTRAQDWITEDRTTNRANELLLTVAESRTVQRITAEQDAWFTRVDTLSDGGSEVASSRLVALQPRLADVDRVVTQAWRELRQENLEGSERRRKRIPVWDQIQQALSPLVGPDADAHDPLVRSHRAHELAERVLHNRERTDEPPPGPPGR